MIYRNSYCKIFLILNIVLCLATIVSGDLFAQTDQNRVKLAQGYERRGDYQSALRIYRALFNQVPKNLVYYEGVKRNLSYLKSYSELKGIIQDRIEQTGEVRFQADMGSVYFLEGNREQAVELWNNIINQSPPQKLNFTHVASAMMINRLYDEAIEVYKQARLMFNQPDAFVFELANAYVLRMKYQDATVEYLNYLEKNPNQFSYIESRIATYTKEESDADLVAEVIKERLQDTKQEYLVRKLLADLYLRMEDYADALQEFKRLENTEKPEKETRGTGKEIYFFAEKSLRAGNYAYAEDAYNIILLNYPKSPYKVRALCGLASAKQKQGFAREALRIYDSVLRDSPGSVWSQLALFQKAEILYADLVEIENAMQAFQRIIKEQPKSKQLVAAHFRNGDCHLATGDIDTAVNWYKRGHVLPSATELQRQQGQYKMAYAYFLAAEYEQSLMLLNNIVSKSADANEQQYVNDALDLMFFIEENQKDSRETLNSYGSAMKFTFQRRYDKAISILNELVSGNSVKTIAEPSLLQLARLYSYRSEHLDAISHLESLLAEYPESIYNDLAQKRIGEIYEFDIVDNQQAITAYEKVLINYPNSVYLEDVRQKLRHLQSLQPNN